MTRALNVVGNTYLYYVLFHVKLKPKQGIAGIELSGLSRGWRDGWTNYLSADSCQGQTGALACLAWPVQLDLWIKTASGALCSAKQVPANGHWT